MRKRIAPLTAICLSAIYLTLCSTPPRIALHRSSVLVSGWMFPRYTVRLPVAMPRPPGGREKVLAKVRGNEGRKGKGSDDATKCGGKVRESARGKR